MLWNKKIDSCFLKLDSCFWFIRQDKKVIKVNLQLSLQELWLQLFACKNIPQVGSKTLTTQCVFTDHLNHKTGNKATCRTPSANV